MKYKKAVLFYDEKGGFFLSPPKILNTEVKK